MGILETRALDFDCLIVMDMNEGSWPPPLRTATLLPQLLRRAYKLPTYREQDATYAYAFHRMLQRSQEVRLFYLSSDSGEATGIEKKQKSRLLHQLKYDYPQCELKEASLQHRIQAKKPEPIHIQKTQALLQSWQKRSRRLQSQLCA